MCTNPLMAIRNPSNLRHPIRILGSLRDSKLNSLPDYCQYDGDTGEVLTPFYIGCGQCVECRLDYSRGWANRCVMEAISHQKENIRNCWFVTLTYNDDSILNCNMIDENSHRASLRFEHLELFNKRLRFHYANYKEKYNWDYDAIRFYACGEYGDLNNRPHFHVLYFDMPIHDKDLKLLGKTKLGYPLYNVDYLTDLWGYGHVVVADLSWETCAYTARYVMKKLKGKQAYLYDVLGIEPEGVRMSRRPGIGLEYFMNHWQDMYYFNDSNDISKGASSKVILPSFSKDRPNVGKPPRYFDEKMKDIDLTLLERVKASRLQTALIHDDNIHRMSTLSDRQRFEMDERTLNRKSKQLIRQFTNFIS